MGILGRQQREGAKTKVIEPMAQDKEKPVATAPTEEQRQSAMERFKVIRPHLEDDAPLAHAARQAGISVRTAERWLARYRQSGLAGLVRSIRNERRSSPLAR